MNSATTMRQIAQQKLSIVFCLLGLLDIIFILTGIKSLHFVVKILLVPVLISLSSIAENDNGKKLLQVGLFFSWMGDALLLFESRHSLFFIFGLVCFLLTHVFYIIFFLRMRPGNRSLLIKQPFWILLVPAYGVGLVWLLYPHLGGMKLPVIAYATVICTVLLCSLHAFSKVNKTAGHFYWLGAACFVLSDSLLAINKFYQPFAYAGAFIMLTYCAAQFFIVKGFLSMTTDNRPQTTE
jgi:uncharacterized membrane protein YhhN